MPGTMFTEVVSPRGSSSRKWHTAPLSLIVHAAIFAVIIVAPLVATGELPMPERLMPSFVIANVVPSPPPAAPRSRPVTTRSTATNTQVPPLEAPPNIGAETGIFFDPELVQTTGGAGLSFARKIEKEGVVIIEAVIGVDGKVQDARVIRSIPLLDQAALDAVGAWEYTPTLLNGRPTPVIMTVTVHFRLSN